MKIHIIGRPVSGKITLAEERSNKTGVPHSLCTQKETP